MPGRFTLAGLLMAVTLVALVLAIVVPTVRHSRRVETHADSITSVAASADGSTFAALMGDGRHPTAKVLRPFFHRAIPTTFPTPLRS